MEKSPNWGYESCQQVTRCPEDLISTVDGAPTTISLHLNLGWSMWFYANAINHTPFSQASRSKKKQEQLIQTISGSFVSISKQYIHTVWENPTENDPKIGDAFGSFNKGAWMGSTSIFESLLFYGSSIQYIYIYICSYI